jgi:hypothetical protein
MLPREFSDLCEHVRDISDYKRAFSLPTEDRSCTAPSTHSWLESYLEPDAPAYPSSDPVHSLFHWVESPQQLTPLTKGVGDDHPPGPDAPETKSAGSPYLVEFTRSGSLDFSRFRGGSGW